MENIITRNCTNDQTAKYYQFTCHVVILKILSSQRSPTNAVNLTNYVSFRMMKNYAYIFFNKIQKFLLLVVPSYTEVAMHLDKIKRKNLSIIGCVSIHIHKHIKMNQ